MINPIVTFVVFLFIGWSILLLDRSRFLGTVSIPITPARILAIALVAAGVTIFFMVD
ncbi:hypothetical protein [Sulfitobacter sp. SK012]|uniref:hypothetical protein n=1 Tax=Sulfitobacter sp. SK012 TaxID=1389005 RepID=UPI0013B3E676|nr:hypothetical protein [Sulfitobacter sp. SK012]